MKKSKILISSITLVLALSVSLFSFTGCKKSDSSNNQTNGQQGYGRRNRNFDPAQMKQRIEDSIKSLVTDKTITQAQADKIVAALTSFTPGSAPQRNGQSTGQNNNQNNQQSNQGNQQNNQNGNLGNRGTDRRSEALKKLVTDGVITQAQADAVLKKLSTGMGRPNGGNQNNNNQNSSNKG